MSECMGNLTVSAKIDREMREYIDREADRRAITPCEMIRRILDVYKASTEGGVACSDCGSEQNMAEVV